MEQLNTRYTKKLDRLWEDLQDAKSHYEQNRLASEVQTTCIMAGVGIYDFLMSKMASKEPVAVVATTADVPETTYKTKEKSAFVCGCGRSFKTQNALNAHKCKK